MTRNWNKAVPNIRKTHHIERKTTETKIGGGGTGTKEESRIKIHQKPYREEWRRQTLSNSSRGGNRQTHRVDGRNRQISEG